MANIWIFTKAFFTRVKSIGVCLSAMAVTFTSVTSDDIFASTSLINGVVEVMIAIIARAYSTIGAHMSYSITVRFINAFYVRAGITCCVFIILTIKISVIFVSIISLSAIINWNAFCIGIVWIGFVAGSAYTFIWIWSTIVTRCSIVAIFCLITWIFSVFTR